MAEKERLFRVLEPGLGHASAVAWSPDGTRLAVGSDEGVVVLTLEGRVLWRDHERGDVTCLDWSHDGRRLAVGGMGRNWQNVVSCIEYLPPKTTNPREWFILNATTGTLVFEGGDHHVTNNVAWSPDDSRLAVVSWDNMVHIYDSRTGRELLALQGETDVHWSPDGQRVASSSDDRSIGVWDAPSGRQISMLSAHDDIVWSMRWSPDGRYLASASRDSTIRIWDAKSYEHIATLRNSEHLLRHLSWAPNGLYLASVSQINLVLIWDVRTTRRIVSLKGHSSSVRWVAFSPDGTQLASASDDGTVRLWDTSDLMQRWAPTAAPPGAAVAAYLTRQATTVGCETLPESAPVSATLVRKLPGAEGNCLGVIEYDWTHNDGHGEAVAFSADGRLLFFSVPRGAIYCQSLATGASVWAVENATGFAIQDMALSPDGLRLAAVDGNVVVHMRNSTNGLLIGYSVKLSVRWAAWCVCWSPDGRRLAVAVADHTVRIVDAATGREHAQIRTGDGFTYAVSWSSTGALIASGGEHHTVRVWTADTYRLALHHEHHQAGVLSLRWSPDGRSLASADESGILCVWNPASKDILRIEAHPAPIWTTLWSPDGQRLASASTDGTICLWSPTTGAKLAQYEFKDKVTDRHIRLAWSPDGTLLASSHPHGIFRLWDTRSTLPRTTAVSFAPAGPIPPALAPLPGALASLLRLRRSAPLSLLRDLLSLTAGHTPSTDAAPLASHPGIRALAALHWPTPARMAFLLLLLRDHNDPSFASPPNTTPAELRWLLLDALGGPTCEPNTPPTPLAFLDRTLSIVDDRLLTLLTALGPDACADNPSLPLTLLSRLPELLPLAAADRHLLSLRVPALTAGHAQITAAGLERAGFAPTGDLLHLVPSQWALPDALRRYRALNGGLLYRSQLGHESPRLRPTVIVLDVSPTCFGPVETLLRTAAYAVASSLLEAGLPAHLVAAGGDNLVRPLQHRLDLFEVLTARALEPVNTPRTLALSRSLRDALSGDSSLEPIILLLSQPWLGADENGIPAPPHLRALFVPYPGYPATPALHRHCERWASLSTSDRQQLGHVLSHLVG